MADTLLRQAQWPRRPQQRPPPKRPELLLSLHKTPPNTLRQQLPFFKWARITRLTVPPVLAPHLLPAAVVARVPPILTMMTTTIEEST